MYSAKKSVGDAVKKGWGLVSGEEDGEMNEEDYSQLFIPSFHSRYVYPPPEFVPPRPVFTPPTIPVPVPTPRGQVVPGNIDLSNRPVIKNADGTVSTERSFSIGTDRGEVLIPQIVGGKVLSKGDAINHYKNTGEHLGIFKDVPSANAAAEAIHNRSNVIIPDTGAAKYFYVDPRAKGAADLSSLQGREREGGAVSPQEMDMLYRSRTGPVPTQTEGIGLLPPNAVNILLKEILGKSPRIADERKDLLKDAEDTFYGGGHAPAPTPTPTPVQRTGASFARV